MSGSLRRTSRLRRETLTPLTLSLSALSTALLTFASLLLLTVPLDRAVGLTGMVFAILAFGATQVQMRQRPVRRIVFLTKSRSPFARSIQRGLRSRLEGKPQLRITEVRPEEGEPDILAWQLSALRGPLLHDAACLVIIPSHNDAALWTELASLIRRGVYVVTIDIKASGRLFAQLNVPRPPFVGSDFSAGGCLVAEHLAELLTVDEAARALVCLGPRASWPAVERGSKMVYTLCCKGMLNRVDFLELPDWDERKASSLIVSALSGRDFVPWYVFTGNDKILVRVARQQRSDLVTFLGYDGIIDEDGRYVVAEHESVVATVDALPTDQGVAAGQFIIDEYEGHRGSLLTTMIQPKLLKFERGGR